MTKNGSPSSKALPAAKLRAAMPGGKIPYDGSAAIPRKNGLEKFQPRAMQALRMALAIRGNEFNVYLSGDATMGRTYFAKSHLGPAAAHRGTPPDWVYIYNFDDPDRPLAVELPAGTGKRLRTEQGKAIADLRKDIQAVFEKEQYHKKLDALSKAFNKNRDELLLKMEETAGTRGFSLEITDQGSLTLSPVKEGRPLSDEDFDELLPDERQRLKGKGEELLTEINTYLRRIAQSEQSLRRDELNLQRETAKAALEPHLGRLRGLFGMIEKLADYYDALEADILDNVDQFIPRESAPALPVALQPEPLQPGDDAFSRYEVNLFVDNSGLKGSPVIVEDHPTPHNLLGSIERESEMGALYTDFTLIKAGAVHKANHGFLLLNAEDVLSHPNSWDGLLRSLRCGHARIEDPVEPDQVRTKTIEPEPIPLDLRIVLVGTDETYETLLYHDDRFQKFFKLKAHLQGDFERNAASIRTYLQVVARIIDEADLLPFDQAALGGIVDLSSRLAEDQKRLSMHFPVVRDRMIEADALARMDGRETVTSLDLSRALADHEFRSNLFEDLFMADYDREVIKVATGGEAVGRANGLSVTMFGDYEFGLPHQISCTVGVGHGGILDLEREAQLGGPIHTKGMMILKSYLNGLFAQDKPIVLTGSLCFEQNYAGVEGDSASGAELAALLSGLSGVPINLAYAFTGAVSQSGAIMAVGGVTRKIEGFFEVCRRRGLTGDQGVLLPADNLPNLLLKDEVVEAVDAGRFHIFPVKTIEEAMFILTGMPSGGKWSKGRFPAGSLYRLVDERLAELARLAEKTDKKKR